MTVTVADVVLLLNGVPNATATGFLFYGHDIATTTIQQAIDLSTRYWVEYLTAGVISDKPLLVDDLILYYAALRIVAGNIMGMLMLSGFSYSTLQLSVQKGNYPQIVKDMADSLLAAVRNYISILCTSGETYASASEDDEIDTDYSP